MSILSEINRISQNIANAYTALLAKGAAMPADENSDNLAATIESIPDGVDTSDATATAGDIVSGATAYVNGEKITGTIQKPRGGITAESAPDIGYLNGVRSLKLNYTPEEPTYISQSTGGVYLCSPFENFGDATAEDVAAGKVFTSAAGLKVVGTREDDGLKIAKLWENASPSSNFAAQTIGLALSDYDAYSIYYKNKTNGSAFQSTGIVPVGQGVLLYYMTTDALSQRRSVTSSTSGITFNGGSSGSSDSNACCIPLVIYGYKGIVDPGLEAAKLYELKNEMVCDGTQSVINTGVQLFDIAKDFTILMDATGSANYNLCLLDAARDSATGWKGGVQFKTNPSWNGVGLRVCGYPPNGSAQVFPIVESTERTKMAVVYVQGVPSKFYFRTASAGGITPKNPDSEFGSWDYVQHDGTVSIGGTASGTEKFIGTIHGCSIYNMVLPENEINKRLAF